MATAKNKFVSLNLHHDITKAIDLCGYTQPTPIQALSIPHILEKKDLVASAQTGSGKTAAFVLPALHLLSKEGPSKKTRILILTPTRELASQITKAARMYGKFMRFNIVNLVGGMPYHHQIKDLARGADIIVATPGRLLDHIEQARVDLSGIQMLVLDEADRMLDMGFIEDVQYIAKLTPSSRQTLLFSATIGKGLANVIKSLLKHPERIDLSNEKIAAPQIRQELYRVTNMQQKNHLLRQLLDDGSIFKAIIFSATKINADKLANQLRDDGFAAAALHGDLRQNVRNRTVEQLRNGKIQFLVATDVAARGIDISDVTHVINYDLPRFSEDYVHRIGRTGRAGKTGIAISFVGPTDQRHLQNIERYLGQRIKAAPPLDGSAHHDQDDALPFIDDRKRSKKHKSKDNRFEKRGDFKAHKPKFKNENSKEERDGFKKRKPKFKDSDTYSEKRYEFKDRKTKPKKNNERFKEEQDSFKKRKPKFKDSNERFREERDDFKKRKPKFGADKKGNKKSFNKAEKNRKSTTEKKRFDNVGGKATERSDFRSFKKRSLNKSKKFSRAR